MTYYVYHAGGKTGITIRQWMNLYRLYDLRYTQRTLDQYWSFSRWQNFNDVFISWWRICTIFGNSWNKSVAEVAIRREGGSEIAEWFFYHHAGIGRNWNSAFRGSKDRERVSPRPITVRIFRENRVAWIVRNISPKPWRVGLVRDSKRLLPSSWIISSLNTFSLFCAMDFVIIPLRCF